MRKENRRNKKRICNGEITQSFLRGGMQERLHRQEVISNEIKEKDFDKKAFKKIRSKRGFFEYE